MKRIYLDYAAAHPVLPSARRAFLKALECYGNPSAPHEEGREAKAILEDARIRIARLAGVKPSAVVFTGNATEANALAIEGTVRKRLAEGAKSADLHLLYLAGAHSSVVRTVEKLEKEGVAADAIPLKAGKLTAEAVQSLLRPTTCLVSLELIMSETGARLDVRAARKAMQGSGALLHVDASQAPLVESFERTRLAADFITLDAQKVGGVRGIGALIMGEYLPYPVIEGGGQERRLRPGTESPALAISFAVALEEALKGREAFVAKAGRLREKLMREIPGVLVNGGKENAPHILNISLPETDTDYLVTLLDEAGFAVSTKSACESDSAEGSRAVLAETQDAARASSTLRVSWGRAIREGDLMLFAKALAKARAFLDRTHS